MKGRGIALVTGSASRLGKAIALSLAKKGHVIIIHFNHSQVEAKRTKEEIDISGGTAFLYQADLLNDLEINKLMDFIDTLPGTLRILVNSASIMKRKEVSKVTFRDWDETISLNLRAAFFISQQSAKKMTDGGVIINLTDAGATRTWINYPAYVISKSGLEGLTRLLAKAYAPKIRVNAIAPGLVLRSQSISPSTWQKLINRTPLRRSISFDDIISTMNFIIENPSITGQTITVDGGYSIL